MLNDPFSTGKAHPVQNICQLKSTSCNLRRACELHSRWNVPITNLCQMYLVLLCRDLTLTTFCNSCLYRYHIYISKLPLYFAKVNSLWLCDLSSLLSVFLVDNVFRMLRSLSFFQRSWETCWVPQRLHNKMCHNFSGTYLTSSAGSY